MQVNKWNNQERQREGNGIAKAQPCTPTRAYVLRRDHFSTYPFVRALEQARNVRQH